jgi:hypothetical protein
MNLVTWYGLALYWLNDGSPFLPSSSQIRSNCHSSSKSWLFYVQLLLTSDTSCPEHSCILAEAEILKSYRALGVRHIGAKSAWRGWDSPASARLP